MPSDKNQQKKRKIDFTIDPTGLVPDEHGIIKFGPMRIGSVPLSSIQMRRANPRAMSEAEVLALRTSIDTHGFKSFLIVEELSPGHYGLVDGHHRIDELEKIFEAKNAPIMILDSKDPAELDLAMLSFNITGSPNGATWVDFVRDLVTQSGADVVSQHIAIPAGQLKDMTDTTQALMDQINAGGESGAMGNHFGGTAFVQRPVRVELTNTPTTLLLLEKAREKAKVATDGQAVLVALQAYVGNDIVEEEKSPDVS